jgi:hypothetical protein
MVNSREIHFPQLPPVSTFSLVPRTLDFELQERQIIVLILVLSRGFDIIVFMNYGRNDVFIKII